MISVDDQDLLPRLQTPSRFPSRAPIAAPLVINHPAPIINAERLLARAIRHQPRKQFGHLHIPTVLRFEGPHIELLAAAAEVADDAQDRLASREQALAHVG
jgi:hypothetical protein